MWKGCNVENDQSRDRQSRLRSPLRQGRRRGLVPGQNDQSEQHQCRGQEGAARDEVAGDLARGHEQPCHCQVLPRRLPDPAAAEGRNRERSVRAAWGRATAPARVAKKRTAGFYEV